MSARGVAAVALALAMACGPAGAGTLVDASAGPTAQDRPGGRLGTGFGVGVVAGAQHWLSIQARLDGTSRDYGSPVSLTFGPRLGSTQGSVRPYLELAFGFSSGSDDAGIVSGYAAGVVADLPGTLALVAFARSIHMGNFEYDGHQAEYRAGIAFIGATRR